MTETPTEIPADAIGWQVLDPDGNVVSSGGVTIAELTSEALEALGLPPKEDE